VTGAEHVSRNDSAWLHGTWQLLRSDGALEIEPGTRMRFEADGSMQYTIPTATGPLFAELVWRVEGDTLFTMLADGTHSTRVGLRRGAGETLVCDFGGAHAWYVRVVE
jgi:hypothetical protein